MSPKTKIAAIVVTGFLAGVGVYLLSRDRPSEVYQKAVAKILEESPDESLQYLLRSDIKKPRELYLLAYNFYLNGNYDRAESLVKVVLLTQPKRKLEGSCHYLSGLIERGRGNTENELAHFTKAVQTAIGTGRNEYLFQMEQAYTQLTLKQFDLFLSAVDEIRPHVEGTDLFRLDQMMCRYYWYIEQYDQCLSLALSLNCLGERRCESIWHLEVSFAYLMNKNVDAARQELTRIDYRDPQIENMVEVFTSVINAKPIINKTPEDNELSSMIAWLESFYNL